MPFSCCCPASLRGELSSEEKINRRINKWIEIESRRAQMEYKILLLGTGGAGKSTFLRQMRILHGEGYSESHRLEYRTWVYRNVFLAIQNLIDATEILGIPFRAGQKSKRISDLVSKIDCWNVVEFDATLLTDGIKFLWEQEPAIAECYERRNEFDLADSAKYFLSSLDRISHPDFIPSQEDVLHLRIPTTGIAEYVFDIPHRKETVQLRIVDVGGQKAERRKWIHCFEEVKTVIFLAALSEYDRKSPEEFTRLEESMNLFHVIFWKFESIFEKSSLILFLNKKDVFEEKIRSEDSNIQEYFPDFNGSLCDPKSVRDFILSRFRSELPEKRLKSFYYHYTCATDTENIKNIFSVVKQRILEEHLKEIGLR